jgi:predicted permease
MGFLALCTVGTLLAFGVPPALMATRASIATMLTQQSRSSTGSPAARRFRAALVVIEVAFSIVLLVGAALMTRSLLKLQAIDIGMDPEGLIAMRLALPSRGYEDPQARDAATAEIVRRARLQPGVTAASAGHLPPIESLITVGPLEFADRPLGPEKRKSVVLRVYSVWPGYFTAAGIRLLEGREPAERDVEGATVVSQNFAEQHWPGRSAVGARFRVGTHPWRTIVGVAAEVRQMSEIDDSGQQELYYPHDQVSGVMHRAEAASTIAEYRTVLVRAASPAAIGRQLTRVVHEVDPRIVVSSTRLVAHQFADAIARPRIVFLMMAVFAGVGLVLAAAGLYAVLSYLVSLRQREIGVRLALGASPRDIARLVFGRGLGLATIGLVLGLGAAAALVKVMQTLLYEVAPSDPTAIAAAVTLIVVTAMTASILPARRAMRIDPVNLLRES